MAESIDLIHPDSGDIFRGQTELDVSNSVFTAGIDTYLTNYLFCLAFVSMATNTHQGLNISGDTSCVYHAPCTVMGNKLVTFTEQQLENYQDCTFFTRKEILRVQKRYRELQPDIVPKCMTANEPVSVKIPVESMERLAELRENPFRKRICQVFSRDGKGNLSFEDFLDLLSVFSEQAPRDIKVYYAFRIYDFDGDKHIGPEDLDQALRLLTRNELTPEDIQQIVEKVVEEGDVDGDGKLSYMEFEHVITRAPDFFSNFHIRM